jgi:hypothetical protein
MKPRGLFKRVFDFARAELERRARALDASDDHPSHEQHGEPAHEAAHPDAVPEFRGLDVVRSHDAQIRLAWSITDAEIERARALIDGDAVLCVRVVAFSPLRDDVLRHVQDRPGVEPRGDCDVGRVEGRAIVSIGLRAGERFVSIVHHTI